MNIRWEAFIVSLADLKKTYLCISHTVQGLMESRTSTHVISDVLEDVFEVNAIHYVQIWMWQFSNKKLCTCSDLQFSKCGHCSRTWSQPSHQCLIALSYEISTQNSILWINSSALFYYCNKRMYYKTEIFFKNCLCIRTTWFDFFDIEFWDVFIPLMDCSLKYPATNTFHFVVILHFAF